MVRHVGVKLVPGSGPRADDLTAWSVLVSDHPSKEQTKDPGGYRQAGSPVGKFPAISWPYLTVARQAVSLPGLSCWLIAARSPK